MKNENNFYSSIIPLVITMLIAFGGNYIITTNKVSALDTEVEIYQDNIKELSDEVAKMTVSVNSLRDQIIEMNGELKMKSDKKLIN